MSTALTWQHLSLAPSSPETAASVRVRPAPTELAATEFVVLPVFGDSGQPDYQVEIHLGATSRAALNELESVPATVGRRLA